MIFNLNDLKIENNKSRVQVSRVGDNMKHRLYGDITITTEDHELMVKNFNENARGLSEGGKPILQFDFKHNEGDKAAGWINNLEMSEDKENLFANVEWTESGVKAIKSKEFKFVSPSIVRDFVNNKTGTKYPVILKGAALTNIPFLTEMEAISALSENQRKKAIELMDTINDVNDIESILKAISMLSDEEKAEIAIHFKTENPEMKKIEKKEDLTESTSENEIKLSEENETLKKENETLKKEQEFLTLLSEGKAVPAQKDAFLKGDMIGFVDAAEEVKLDETGEGREPKKKDEIIKTKEDAEEKLMELAEERAKKEEIPYTVAMKQVYSENPKIVELTE